MQSLMTPTAGLQLEIALQPGGYELAGGTFYNAATVNLQLRLGHELRTNMRQTFARRAPSRLGYRKARRRSARSSALTLRGPERHRGHEPRATWRPCLRGRRLRFNAALDWDTSKGRRGLEVREADFERSISHRVARDTSAETSWSWATAPAARRRNQPGRHGGRPCATSAWPLGRYNMRRAVDAQVASVAEPTSRSRAAASPATRRQGAVAGRCSGGRRASPGGLRPRDVHAERLLRLRRATAPAGTWSNGPIPMRECRRPRSWTGGTIDVLRCGRPTLVLPVAAAAHDEARPCRRSIADAPSVPQCAEQPRVLRRRQVRRRAGVSGSRSRTGRARRRRRGRVRPSCSRPCPVAHCPAGRRRRLSASGDMVVGGASRTR